MTDALGDAPGDAPGDALGDAGTRDTHGPAQARRGDTSLGRVLGQAERQVSRMLDAALVADGLTLDQWRVLDLLSDGDGHPMSEIAAAIVVPGPTLTKIVDKLVEAAAVYRLVDGRDRRRVLAFVSDSGRLLHERLLPVVVTAEAEALLALGAEAPTLLSLLGRLADGLGGRA